MGDVVTKIGGSPTDRMRHKEAQEQIIMAGNSLELSLQRSAFIRYLILLTIFVYQGVGDRV